MTGAKVTTTNTAISTVGNNSHAVHAYSGASGETLVPTIQINGGTISTTGDESWGLFSQRTGNITGSAAITTSGLAGFGAFAEDGAGLTLNGGSITTTGGALGGTIGSFGVLSKNGSTVSVNNVSINTSGALADGLRSDKESSSAGGIINATSTTINTSGSNAHGVSVYGGGGKVTMQGGSIAATGAGSSAAYIKDSGTVSLTGTSLTSAGATFASNFTQAGQAQSITLGSGTAVTGNNGSLIQVTRTVDGADGTVAFNLGAGSFAQGNVYDMDGSKLVTVNKTGDAQWAGMVVDKSTEQIDPNTPPAPNYTTTESVIVSSSAPVTFTGTTSMGGFSGATGGTSTFAGPASITGDLIGAQGSSTNFSNNANIGGSITSGSGSTTTFSGPSTTIGGSVGGNGGTFAFSRTGSTSIGGSLNLSGTSQVTGGTIDNPITVGGDATVGAGSVLGGNLVVAGALGGSGGVVAPGNSIGTQTYGSSAGFAGNYAVEVNAAGKSDLIIISNGNFDLSNIGLGVGQENGNGGYVLNHDYTIIQTPGGQVENTFKSTALDNSFAGTLVKLDPVKYGAKDVKVSLSVDNSAAQAKRAGLSGNQNATLDGVLSVAGKNTAADAALQSTDTAGAMNQLSGEVHASTSSALLAAGGLVQRTVAQRMRGNLGVGMMAGAPTAQAGGAPVAGSMPQSAALPLWAQVVGNWNTLSDDGNAAKVKSNMGGVFIGGDTAVGSGWRVGGALGFTDGQIDVDDRSSRTKARSYTASLYGGKSWATGKGSVNFLAGAAYTRHNLDSRRSITLAGGQKLTADYHANSAQLFTELGYALPVGANSVVEPYAGLAWLSQRMQGFSESGGSAALRSDSQTDTVTTFTLGLRGKTTMELSAGKRVTLFAGLGWRHASGDVTSTRNLAFIQGNGASFQVSGAPVAKNAALVDAGVEASIGRNAALGLSYNGQYGSGNTNHVGSLYVKMRF
ncbi:autotransporter outer membrane beta-barrel domain-containing protein [Eoetvoesiella caeni]